MKKMSESAPVTLMLPVTHEKSGTSPSRFAIRMKRKSVQKKGMKPRPEPLPPKFGSTISSRMKTTYFSISSPRPLGTRPIFRRARKAIAHSNSTNTSSITTSLWKMASLGKPMPEIHSEKVLASGVPSWCNTWWFTYSWNFANCSCMRVLSERMTRNIHRLPPRCQAFSPPFTNLPECVRRPGGAAIPQGAPQAPRERGSRAARRGTQAAARRIRPQVARSSGTVPKAPPP